MIRLLILLLLLSCGKPQNGSDGLSGTNGFDGENGPAGQDGHDGYSYYSYVVSANIQEIIGDGVSGEFYIDEGNLYQLPSEFQVIVDNERPECVLKDLEVVFETESEDLIFTFKAHPNNRYKMNLKSGPVEKLVDTSYIKVYYKGRPEVDCGNAVYRLHSGIQFDIRVFKKIEVE